MAAVYEEVVTGPAIFDDVASRSLRRAKGSGHLPHNDLSDRHRLYARVEGQIVRYRVIQRTDLGIVDVTPEIKSGAIRQILWEAIG